MKPDKLVLMVSEDCNFNCLYCYHTRQKKAMSRETAEKALDFFLPRMPEITGIYFLGGEPLLNAGLIREAVEYAEKRNQKTGQICRYHISTNGSLITPDNLYFFDQYQFTVELSFDGLAQDLGREKGSFQKLVRILGELKKSPGINLVLNSVFYPITVSYLSESIRYFLDLDVPHISLGLALDTRWDNSSIDTFEFEFKRLMDLLPEHVRRTNSQPLHVFPDLEEKGIWYCPAGQSQLTVTADGEIWGCALFYGYFKKKKSAGWRREYCFGTLDDFSRNHKKKYPEIVGHYRQLGMDNFYTPTSRCFLCPEVEKCGVCPITSAFCRDDPERVPGHICRINRIAIREKERLLSRLKDLKTPAN